MVVPIDHSRGTGLPDGKPHSSVFPCFDIIPECDGQMDGRTDGWICCSIYNICKTSFAVCCTYIKPYWIMV